MLDAVKLKYWSFIPRKGSGRRSDRVVDPELAPAAIERGRDGVALERGRARGAVRRDAPRGDRGDALRRRRAARRARRRHRDVRRQPQHQLHQRLRGRLRLLRLRPGQALARRLHDHARRTSPSAIREAVEFGATEICMQGGIHPDYTLEHYGRWLRLAKEVAPQLHLHAYSPMEVHYMCERSGKAPEAVFDYLLRVRARLDARHRGRGARRRRPRADLAQQAAGGALGRDHRGLRTAPACDRPRP